MASITLLPNALDAVYHPSIWTAGSGNRQDAVASVDGSAPALSEDTDGTAITFTLDDFTVADATVTSVQHSVWAHSGGRAPQTTSIRVDMLDADGTGLYYDAHIITVNGGSPAQYDGTSRTTWNGSQSWSDPDYTKLNNLKLKLTLLDSDYDGDGTSYDAVVYSLYVTVTYSLPPTPTYSSDDNVILKNGLTELKNGLTIIK